MQPEGRDREDVGASLGVLAVDLLDEVRAVEKGLGAPEGRREVRAAAEKLRPERRVEDERRPRAQPLAERNGRQRGSPGRG
jgi:hypothetical protein